MNDTEKGTGTKFGSWKLWTAIGLGAVAGTVVAVLYRPAGPEASVDAKSASVKKSGESGLSMVKVALYTAYAKTARFQIERLFQSITAGVDEAKRVREEIEASRKHD
ncbi:MAG TPA: hypothetical protein PLN69_12105 [bacterium]|nr:hypothetical protein [bacterium]